MANDEEKTLALKIIADSQPAKMAVLERMASAFEIIAINSKVPNADSK